MSTSFGCMVLDLPEYKTVGKLAKSSADERNPPPSLFTLSVVLVLHVVVQVNYYPLFCFLQQQRHPSTIDNFYSTSTTNVVVATQPGGMDARLRT